MNGNQIDQFRDAIEAAGLTAPAVIVADGKLRRFASNGKRSDGAGWYVFHANGVAAGAFGDWRTGFSQTWRADIGRNLTPAEESAHRAKVAAMQRRREAEEKKLKDEARKEAASIWKASLDPAGHSYLIRKGIKAHGARLHQGKLVIPMYADDKIHSLQFIHTDGSKKYLTGGRAAGCYFAIGDTKGAAALCVCEGFATAGTIHEATGHPVAVAFSAGNLEAVAKAMQERFPHLPLILCADDDHRTEGNPGLTKATEAARAIDGLLALPAFGENRPDGATDFNDLAALHGLEAVKDCIEAVFVTPVTPAETLRLQGEAAPILGCTLVTLVTPENISPQNQISQKGEPAIDGEPALSENGVTQVTGVTPNNDGLSAVTPAGFQEVTGVTESPVSQIPGVNERPRFIVFDDWEEHGGAKYRPGVWFFSTDNDGSPTQTWVCSPLHVEAVTYDGQDNHFGRLLRFKNTLGRWREWAMPMELLRGTGDELRGELLAMGVEIDPTTKARNILATYLQGKPPKRRMRCALQVGWCEDSFVLPDTVIGARASGVIFQSGERGHDEHTKGGTLAGWQTEISARAVGNPMMVLGISGSFAGPLLKPCNAESGGIHFVGDSSIGKTTIKDAACSTWGGPNYGRSWRATANGMEGAAALFNDCLLALDDIGEAEPKEVGTIVYALGNGTGKQRAGRSGNARAVVHWRCFVLSNGERTIATTMMEGGHRAKAGQAVRLLDIPALRRFGVLDNLHGFQSGAAFSDAIKRAAATHHGLAGRAFLEKLTRDGRDFCALLERIKALPAFSADRGEGQDKRAAGRFALLALAGELATEYGLTGWPEGEAINAAAEGFKVWRAMRGRGNNERRQILERVSDFIERHGDGRFSDADATGETQTRDRTGWWRNNAEGREYLFTSEGMREALKGFDFNRALDALQEAGALPAPGADGKRAKPERIKARGAGSIRLYTISTDKLGGNYGA